MARIKGLKKFIRYPDEFRIWAVELANPLGLPAEDVADDLGIHAIWRVPCAGERQR